MANIIGRCVFSYRIQASVLNHKISNIFFDTFSFIFRKVFVNILKQKWFLTKPVRLFSYTDTYLVKIIQIGILKRCLTKIHLLSEPMQFPEYKTNYLKILEKSFIISVSSLILIFYCSQRKQGGADKMIDYELPALLVVEIPRTVQILHDRKPPPTKPVIPVASDEMDILEDIEIDLFQYDIDIGTEIGGGNKAMPSIMPRQIVEVMPEEMDSEVKGIISLSLLVGRDGRIIKHKVLKNTTRNPLYLKNIVRTAYKSKWMPAVLNGSPIDYWVTKTYSFN